MVGAIAAGLRRSDRGVIELIKLVAVVVMVSAVVVGATGTASAKRAQWGPYGSPDSCYLEAGAAGAAGGGFNPCYYLDDQHRGSGEGYSGAGWYFYDDM